MQPGSVFVTSDFADIARLLRSICRFHVLKISKVFVSEIGIKWQETAILKHENRILIYIGSSSEHS
jgi:hypothetical protein